MKEIKSKNNFKLYQVCLEKDNNRKRPQVKKATFKKKPQEDHIENICKKATVR